MKTIWDYSLEHEAKRLILCAHQMATGFYRVNNFIVLPFGHPSQSTHTVSFPDLNYLSINRFWEKAKQTKILDFPINPPKKYLHDVVELFKNSGIVEPEYKNSQKSWDKIQDNIITEIEKILPYTKGKIKNIIIHPTRYGTTVSFSRTYNKPSDVEMYLREDSDAGEITEAIITHLTRDKVYRDYDGLWQESELLVDFLIGETKLKKILNSAGVKKYIPTINIVRAKQKAKLIKESEMFYKKLGLVAADQVFTVKNSNIFIAGKKVENLNKREQQILKLLVENSNKVTTFDEIFEALYSETDDFSLWAITKMMQRVRNKFEDNGISGSYIQTLRGQGYLLKN